LFFTQTQLAYLLNRRSSGSSLGLIGCSITYIILSAFLYAIFTAFNPGIAIASSLVFQLLIIWFAFASSKGPKNELKERKVNTKMLFLIGICLGVFGLSLSFYLTPMFLSISALFIGLFSLYLGFLRFNNSILGQEFLFLNSTFKTWLDRWQSLNGDIPKLLPSPKTQTENVAISPDVSAYSFDRLIVCDRPEIAQFLIRNNFHFENNCAVLSISGYPEAIFETTMEMLYRNPNLQVYALHDCSPEGLDMISTLQTSDRWFKDRNVLILDIGLTPRQVLSAKNLFIKNSTRSAQDATSPTRKLNWQGQGLTSQEIQWLEAGNYVELESFTPQRLMQVINLGILGSRDLVSGDDYSSGMMAGYLMSGDNFG
jgi:hypothetical protein